MGCTYWDWWWLSLAISVSVSVVSIDCSLDSIHCLLYSCRRLEKFKTIHSELAMSLLMTCLSLYSLLSVSLCSCIARDSLRLPSLRFFILSNLFIFSILNQNFDYLSLLLAVCLLLNNGLNSIDCSVFCALSLLIWTIRLSKPNAHRISHEGEVERLDAHHHLKSLILFRLKN